MNPCKHSSFCEHCGKIDNQLRELISDYRYKSYRLAVDLNNMTERDHMIRNALDKVIYDLEAILN